MIDLYPLMQMILSIYFVPALGVGIFTSLLGLLLMVVNTAQQSFSSLSD